jgi:hypothetical protein
MMSSAEWRETKLKVKPACNKLIERVLWINFTIQATYAIAFFAFPILILAPLFHDTHEN